MTLAVTRERLLQGQAKTGLVGAAPFQRGQRRLRAKVVQARDVTGTHQAGNLVRRRGEQLLHALRHWLERYAEGAGERGMRVQVDQQHLVAARGQAAAERQRGGGLADATFLVGNGPDTHQ
ncbi:hypothetical protein D3C81_866890 [compost metagenome]